MGNPVIQDIVVLADIQVILADQVTVVILGPALVDTLVTVGPAYLDIVVTAVLGYLVIPG